MEADQDAAARWARTVLDAGTALILDTETTGLGYADEIVQIAIIDLAGTALLDTFVKPTRPIPHDAYRIHRIANATVAQSPSFADLVPQLRQILAGAEVLIYNAAYDERLLEQSAQAHRLDHEVPIFGVDAYRCVMEQYSAWVGDYSSYHRNYRYQPLPGGDHTALGDCRACLEVIRRMAMAADPVVQLRSAEAQ